MSDNGNHWPKDAPDPSESAYNVFTNDTAEETARIKFRDRYEQEPEWIIDYLGFLWVGPVPEGMG